MRVTPNLSSKTVEKILKSAGQSLDAEKLRVLTNSIAKKSLELGNDLTAPQIAQTIKEETGLDVNLDTVSRYIGQDWVCILVRMKPGASSAEVKKYAVTLGARSAHILYGSPHDLVILGPMYVDDVAFVDFLREKFPQEIEQTLTAIID